MRSIYQTRSAAFCGPRNAQEHVDASNRGKDNEDGFCTRPLMLEEFDVAEIRDVLFPGSS